MDVIKVECDPDLEAHTVSLDFEDFEQDVKEEPLDVPVSISSEETEVRNIIDYQKHLTRNLWSSVVFVGQLLLLFFILIIMKTCNLTYL